MIKTDTDVTIYIEERSKTSEVADIFAKLRLVKDPFIFKAFAYLHQKLGSFIQPGEYSFPAGSNLYSMFHKILRGDRIVRQVTFPEGVTNYQVLEILKMANGVVGELIFPIKEGYLMPDTYYFHYGETRISIVRRMEDQMDTFLKAQWDKRGENLAINNIEEAVILASIIEKETGIPSERTKVSSVFHNRIKLGMPLQADPTVIYAVTGGNTDYTYTLFSKDLKFNSPYNTYINKGLPPTPICNPSRESVKAALHPEDTDYVYFVADGNGGHTFATGYKEHRKNVETYRNSQTKEQN
jgi:UPF0755 protein